MVKDRPLVDVIERLQGRKPFTLSRWGDNEWHCLFGERNGYTAKDGYCYFFELQQQLWRVLDARPAYCLGLSTQDERAWQTIRAMSADDLDWGQDRLPGVVGSAAYQCLIAAVHAKPLVVVGPSRLCRVRHTQGYKAFVDVPPKHAYLCREHLVRETRSVLDDFKEPVLVSVSAGVCAPLLIDDLFKKVGDFHQLVDFGGLWDELE